MMDSWWCVGGLYYFKHMVDDHHRFWSQNKDENNGDATGEYHLLHNHGDFYRGWLGILSLYLHGPQSGAQSESIQHTTRVSIT